MASIGAISYGIGAVFFAVFTIVMLTNWRGRLQGGLLVLATSVSALWAVLLAMQSAYRSVPIEVIWLIEVLRDACWFLFLFKVLGTARGDGGGRGLQRLRWLVLSFCVLVLVVQVFYPVLVGGGLHYVIDATAVNVGHIMLAVIGLVLVEQLYRNTRPEQRWSVKFLCLGLLGMFAYDLYLYAEALMFRVIDLNIWNARGAVNAMVVPLLAISAARNPQWSLNMFVSRGVIFHTTALIGAGLYLLIMAAAGYYISFYGGEWGPVLQVVFLAGAVIFLVVLGFSGQLRARAKVFLNKHFFHSKYDYREEWLRLIWTLSSSEGGTPLYERVIRVIAEIVESPGGALWVRRESGQFVPVARWGMPAFDEHELAADSELVAYLTQKQWIIDLPQLRAEPDLYDGLQIPQWLESIPRGWLLLPMMQRDEVLAFVLLVEPRARQMLDWENIDLLKTAGRQAASYLAQNDAAEALAEARQFEAFNRFSAFVIHDLKTLIAQLSLVSTNATRHMDNPEFIEDAMKTVRHSVDKMNRLMQQLKGAVPAADVASVDLAHLVADVIRGKSAQHPVPELTNVEQGLKVRGDRDRIASVIGHIVQNAQDATPKDGYVHVSLCQVGTMAVVEVTDNGSGMDAAFLRDRLFRPFDSTKGLTGMGIGAYESRELVRALGGDIKVKSEPGQGSHFRIQLPVVMAVEATGIRHG